MDQCESAYARVGHPVKNFVFSVYNPPKGEFEEHSFNEYADKKKWLVLVFYPADFTFVCPTELADVARQHDAFKKLGAQVISISTDSKYAHLAWRNSERLIDCVNYPMGSDPTGNIARYFGVYDEENGTALRGSFIINPQGILVAAEITYHNLGRNSEELLRKLQACVYLTENPDKATPAGWREGEQALQPQVKDVGKVYEQLEREKGK